VSGPDMRSVDEAREYVSELRAILVATGVSDGKMEEGSMRVDANVSVRREGEEKLGTRCEIKNLNSLRSLGRAIEYEARRQVDVVTDGERVIQQTRHWDEADGRTHAMRSKEEAEDYRYFPEPDLVPLAPDAEWIERIRAALPLLPAARRARLADGTGAERSSEAVVVVVQRGQDDQALAAIAAGGDPGRVLVHIQQNLGVAGGADLDPARLAALVTLETSGTLTATQAKQVLAEMLVSDQSPEAIAASRGYEAMDAQSLGAVVDDVIASHASEWEQIRSADPKLTDKLIKFFVGRVMGATKGQADAKAVKVLLAERATDGQTP
jgi:aspartyl-tRNA(Asn)/glutamyl-tRNA(Gln) amidotransferase subunit B